jgi:hypothetical protein
MMLKDEAGVPAIFSELQVCWRMHTVGPPATKDLAVQLRLGGFNVLAA